MNKKPRICAVGMFNSVYDIQLKSLMDVFMIKGVKSIKTTYLQNNFFKFIDIFFFLPCNRKKYDVIHVQSHSYLNIVSVIETLFWSKVLKKKLIVMYYGGGAKEFFSVFPWLIKSIFRNVDEVVVAGKYVQSAFLKLNIKTTIIPHVLEIDKWPNRIRKNIQYNFLWVRHFTSEYNPIMLLQVFKQLKEKYRQLDLKIVGTGPLQEKMENYILENSLNDIELLGRVSDSELKTLFNLSDLFINTTNVDNQPVSVIEAMTCGVPVVSTNVGGIPDIITHKENGLLSNPGDVDAMVENIQLLLENSELASKLSKSGREFVENTFSSEIIFQQWEKVYDTLGFTLNLDSLTKT